MGRTSRAKKERRKAKRKTRAATTIPVLGPTMGVVGRGGALGDEHGLFDDCPICTAMRQMGLQAGDTTTPEQFEQLQDAFEEARRQGAGGWSARGEN
jgi:hypothetical protein